MNFVVLQGGENHIACGQATAVRASTVIQGCKKQWKGSRVMAQISEALRGERLYVAKNTHHLKSTVGIYWRWRGCKLHGFGRWEAQLVWRGGKLRQLGEEEAEICNSTEGRRGALLRGGRERNL